MCLSLTQLSDQLLNRKSIETFWRRKINSSLFFDRSKIDTGLRRLECHNYFRLSCCRCRCVRSECWADSRTQSLCCWLQSRSLWRGHRTKRWTQTCFRSTCCRSELWVFIQTFGLRTDSCGWGNCWIRFWRLSRRMSRSHIRSSLWAHIWAHIKPALDPRVEPLRFEPPLAKQSLESVAEDPIADPALDDDWQVLEPTLDPIAGASVPPLVCCWSPVWDPVPVCDGVSSCVGFAFETHSEFSFSFLSDPQQFPTTLLIFRLNPN
jgi:hypothetical protein